MLDPAASAWRWVSETILTSPMAWFIAFAVMLAVAIFQDACEHWRDDLPWYGWDLRRWQRWQGPNRTSDEGLRPQSVAQSVRHRLQTVEVATPVPWHRKGPAPGGSEAFAGAGAYRLRSRVIRPAVARRGLSNGGTLVQFLIGRRSLHELAVRAVWRPLAPGSRGHDSGGPPTPLHLCDTTPPGAVG
jgi:hypothetical protein